MEIIKKIIQKYLTIRLNRINSLSKKFELIYKSNYWNSKESISGPGSTLIYTENIRNELLFL